MQVDELTFEDASNLQKEIGRRGSKAICTKFCGSSFLRYHNERDEAEFKSFFLSGLYEKSRFILPLSYPLENPNQLLSHLGSPYAGMCINSDQPEKIKGAYDTCFRLIAEKFPEVTSLEIRLPPAVVSQSTPIHEWALWSLGCVTTGMYLGRYFAPTKELNFNRNRKRRIDKIDKLSMKIDLGGIPSPEVYALLVKNREERHSVKPTHSLSDFQRIEKFVPGTLRTYQIRHTDDVCSAAIIFEDSDFATIQYLAGSECSFACGSQDLLVQRLIENYKDYKKILLFGTSTEPEQNHMSINSGLDNYKESFGASAYVSSRLTKYWAKEDLKTH